MSFGASQVDFVYQPSNKNRIIKSLHPFCRSGGVVDTIELTWILFGLKYFIFLGLVQLVVTLCGMRGTSSIANVSGGGTAHICFLLNRTSSGIICESKSTLFASFRGSIITGDNRYRWYCWQFKPRVGLVRRIIRFDYVGKESVGFPFCKLRRAVITRSLRTTLLQRKNKPTFSGQRIPFFPRSVEGLIFADEVGPLDGLAPAERIQTVGDVQKGPHIGTHTVMFAYHQGTLGGNNPAQLQQHGPHVGDVVKHHRRGDLGQCEGKKKHEGNYKCFEL